MGRDSRIGRGSRLHDSGGTPLMPIFLIIGLVVGIPTVIGLVVVGLIFAFTYFVAKKAVEGGNQVVQEIKKEQDDMMARANAQAEANRQKQEEDNLKRAEEFAKKQQDFFKNKGKFPADFPDFPFENKGKTPKVPPLLPPVDNIPGTNTIDLLALIDPSKDAVKGDSWKVVNQELHCPQAIFVPRIEIPYIPPAEYDFIVTFSQSQLRNGVSLIMPNPKANADIKSKSIFFFLGNEGGRNFGFGAEPGNQESKFSAPIKVNTRYTVTVQVRRNSVKALIGSTELMAHNTDFSDLVCDDWRQIRDTRHLAVACDDPTIFHQIRLLEVNGTGRRTR